MATLAAAGRDAASTREVKLLEARPQGNGWIARLEGVDERDAASRLTGQTGARRAEELLPTGGGASITATTWSASK